MPFQVLSPESDEDADVDVTPAQPDLQTYSLGLDANPYTPSPEAKRV